MTMMNIVNQEENTPEIRCCDYRRARHLVRAFCLGNLASLQLLLWQVLDIHEYYEAEKDLQKKEPIRIQHCGRWLIPALSA
jgi:hypothetical protein